MTLNNSIGLFIAAAITLASGSSALACSPAVPLSDGVFKCKLNDGAPVLIDSSGNQLDGESKMESLSTSIAAQKTKVSAANKKLKKAKKAKKKKAITKAKKALAAAKGELSTLKQRLTDVQSCISGAIPLQELTGTITAHSTLLSFGDLSISCVAVSESDHSNTITCTTNNWQPKTYDDLYVFIMFGNISMPDEVIFSLYHQGGFSIDYSSSFCVGLNLQYAVGCKFGPEIRAAICDNTLGLILDSDSGLGASGTFVKD